MIRTRTRLLGAFAAAGTACLLLLSPALANAAGYPVTNVTGANGEAGYYAADDGGTHYRFVETTVAASPALNDLNGENGGAVGVTLCDPNTGYAVQLGLWDNSGQFNVSYADGTLPGSASSDPCIDAGFVDTSISSAPQLVGPHAPTTVTVNTGDLVYLAIYYDPTASHGHHTLVIDADNLTQGWSRQFQTHISAKEFYEFGIGAVNNDGINLTAPAANLLETFNNDQISCYGCQTHFPISRVHTQGGPYVPGTGLREAQFVNSSSQVLMSPNGSLGGPPLSDTFSMFEGSTSP